LVHVSFIQGHCRGSWGPVDVVVDVVDVDVVVDVVFHESLHSTRCYSFEVVLLWMD